MDKKSVELEVDLNQLQTSNNKTNPPKNGGGGGGGGEKQGEKKRKKRATVFVLCNTWIFSIHVF